MKAYEAAKLTGMKSKAFCEQYGIKSHTSKIPADLEEQLFGEEKKTETEPQPETPVDSVEAVVVEDDFPVLKINDEGERCPYSPEEIELSIRCLGGVSPCYKWKHLSA
jgi:hypothetical protein